MHSLQTHLYSSLALLNIIYCANSAETSSFETRSLNHVERLNPFKEREFEKYHPTPYEPSSISDQIEYDQAHLKIRPNNPEISDLISEDSSLKQYDSMKKLCTEYIDIIKDKTRAFISNFEWLYNYERWIISLCRIIIVFTSILLVFLALTVLAVIYKKQFWKIYWFLDFHLLAKPRKKMTGWL